jgi:DNA polymerase alpha subunit A
MDRPSRRGANKAAKAEAAAAQLKNLREKGLKRIDTVAEAEDNAVYDVVTDEEYAKIVNKRREEYGGFVVGEDGDECVPFPFPAFALPAVRARSKNQSWHPPRAF